MMGLKFRGEVPFAELFQAAFQSSSREHNSAKLRTELIVLAEQLEESLACDCAIECSTRLLAELLREASQPQIALRGPAESARQRRSDHGG